MRHAVVKPAPVFDKVVDNPRGLMMVPFFCRKDTVIFVCQTEEMHETGRKCVDFCILATDFVCLQYHSTLDSSVKFLYTCKDTLHFFK